MKLTCFLILVFVLVTSAASFSQSGKLNLSLKNGTLVDALKQIEDQSEYYFYYNNDEIKSVTNVSIQIDNRSVEDVLNELLSGTGLEYKIVDRFIVVKKIEDSVNNQQVQQQKNINGKVTDTSGVPLPGVTVVVKGTTNGVITNVDGNYSLTKVPIDGVLIFSFVGLKLQEVSVVGKTILNVKMEEETVGIEEVVAIGYGTVKKSDLTGSVASVSSDDIQSIPTAQLSRAIQGRAAGVQVLQNSGAPGAGMQIRIRGTNSISGNNEPLWIVDGFPGNPDAINSSDIESMEILKDASATAIYGSRGANGVIIITTRSGKSGETRVTYDGSFGIQTASKKLDLLNAREYMEYNNIQQLNNLGKVYFTQQDIDSAGEGTDWQDLLYRPAFMQDQTISVNGGNEKNQFSMSAGLFNQDGIVLESFYKRKSLRAKFNHNISDKLSVLYNMTLSNIEEKNEYAGGGLRGNSLISAIYGAPPTVTPYMEDGTYRELRYAYPFMSDGLLNPIAYVNERSGVSKANRVLATLGLVYKPIKDLSVDISGNYSSVDSRTDSYTTLKYPNSTGSGGITISKTVQLVSNNIITYNKLFDNTHNVTITGGATYEQLLTTGIGISGSGFLSDATQNYDIGSASVIGTPSSSYTKWQLLSFLGRLNYSYKGKYSGTISFRADGSSRYSEGDKWGYFPSGVLAYRISEENFMKVVPFISDLKLRVGYGETGSTAISPYTTLNMLGTNKVVFNDASYTSFDPSSRFPGPLRWESTAQSDFGVDVSLFDQKVRLTADYYIKNTKGLLNSVQLPRSLGYDNTIQNIGKMQNKGVEFHIEANIIDQKFKWDVAANVSINKNKVVELYDSQDILAPNLNITVIVDYLNLIREGQPMNVFYGYKEAGYDNKGNFIYADLNEDGSITSADRTYIGDPNPDFIYGFNSNMSWKNFEFNFFIQGTQGNDIYALSMAAQTVDYGMGLNTIKEALSDHWTAENPNAKYPNISTTTKSKISDRFVYDGSYVRLRNIQLAYNIPVNKLGSKFLKKGQLYVSGQNLLTITNYPWQDPEINTFGGDNSLRQGIDHYSYPVSKSFTFGVKLDF
ncbi:MAG: SusC/RagA family TonB-linked outer membrane protein [Bacteroidetes bacterium GWF2_42_66]|nr:MAG: SusC/RagA family TonB-linked outer membrane protein [Bacteroidetes bacterium GWA2_42_15]OFX96389.1 MAG: SusC/RagA family TonB-linked outer membrane protein [Bacteroidetes bacterium GWE2_42_39]OFY46428.1 MAG: SusC/RagA family TonB-linked outer membrane protein [Bacteroidetes bacterium GWF2_42_66]